MKATLLGTTLGYVHHITRRTRINTKKTLNNHYRRIGMNKFMIFRVQSSDRSIYYYCRFAHLHFDNVKESTIFTTRIISNDSV